MSPLTFQIVPTPVPQWRTQRHPRLHATGVAVNLWHGFLPWQATRICCRGKHEHTEAVAYYRSWPVLKPLPNDTLCTESTVCIINNLLTLSNDSVYEICTAVKSSFGGLALNEYWHLLHRQNFYIFSHSLTDALRQKLQAGRQHLKLSAFWAVQHSSISVCKGGWFPRHAETQITEHILTHKRGKWTPSRGVFPAHCKGNFAVCDNARFFCERCWTSVCTGCCPVLCSRNRR